MVEIVLLVVFIISLVVLKILRKEYQFALAGKIAMSAMLVVAFIGRFKFPHGLAMMLPDVIPYRLEMVYLTGFLELFAAVGLLIPRFQALTARLLILFFILILPANIYGAIHHVNIETASFDGPGPVYLWFRIPLQLFFIAWVYLFALKKYSTIAINKKPALLK
ncbi:DoxX family protein [Olivibacter domesticus]|uniref:Uncharacterized membrane protein n=1 Tax=Olivibacter domesticus TaxID=407022 RepID=A0A1H7HJE4_OLID1|nr:hypothetical protein [Olivibacter domesticus]SEK49050.1 Uncharacterized membrane protein [Olivibacter domesticus]